MTPDQFVWWLRGYFEASAGTVGAVDHASIRDMLAHVPFEAPAARLGGPAFAQNPPCGCGGHR